MAFDRAAARAAGYSDEEIDAYLQANPEAAKDTPPATAATKSEPPPPTTTIPEISHTGEILGTGALGVGQGAALLKEVAGPAATLYGAYKLGQVANALGQRVAGAVAPAAMPAVGTAANPIGASTAAAAAPAEEMAAGKFAQVASRYAPAAGALSRVAGPLGYAAGAYEAMKFAQEQELGKRLAQGQGRMAQQAFRNLAYTNVSGYTPSAQEARNILASGDERTITMYGGRSRLSQIANPNGVNSGFAAELRSLGR